MGEYINPRDGSSKEQFLTSHGREINDPSEAFSTELPVCLMNNGRFTAAGIAYDEREVRAFTMPGDDRPKKWYAVPLEKLRPFMSHYALADIGKL